MRGWRSAAALIGILVLLAGCGPTDVDLKAVAGIGPIECSVDTNLKLDCGIGKEWVFGEGPVKIGVSADLGTELGTEPTGALLVVIRQSGDTVERWRIGDDARALCLAQTGSFLTRIGRNLIDIAPQPGATIRITDPRQTGTDCDGHSTGTFAPIPSEATISSPGPVSLSPTPPASGRGTGAGTGAGTGVGSGSGSGSGTGAGTATTPAAPATPPGSCTANSGTAWTCVLHQDQAVLFDGGRVRVTGNPSDGGDVIFKPENGFLFYYQHAGVDAVTVAACQAQSGAQHWDAVYFADLKPGARGCREESTGTYHAWSFVEVLDSSKLTAAVPEITFRLTLLPA